MSDIKQKGGFSVRAYQGDAKTLLAFNLSENGAKNLAGFTIQYAINDSQSFYVYNELQFKNPSHHAQVANQPATSSINAPVHKFRWIHIPGSFNQGTVPFYGPYTYTVTPRYFDDNNSMLAIDPKLSVSITVDVKPFSKGKIELGFTRGFVQSEAFVHHFSEDALFRPAAKKLIFDTSKEAGTNKLGKTFTFADEYAWSGFTARTKIFETLNMVVSDKSLTLDMFAYDLNEPDILNLLLQLADEGRIRLILDNAALHHNTTTPKAEDQFEKLFNAAAKGDAVILRGHFQGYAHDKVLIVSRDKVPLKVLSGSTNFSITGMYVNSNHVIVFNDPEVAALYAKVFEEVLKDKATLAFNQTPEASQYFTFETLNTEISFAPHQLDFASKVLGDLANRIAAEKKAGARGSVLFAVMGLATGSGPVLPALKALHSDESMFSCGISDAPGGVYLYTQRKKSGVLVSGKPTQSQLPPPFDQVHGVGIGHQVHHKFVVCGFNGKNPVVYLGSSNLALGGEQHNGDNLIAITDEDIATVFAIEALALVDHFDFLDRCASKAKVKPDKIKDASRQRQAQSSGWFLSTSDKWIQPYFDTDDLHCVDRELFA